jgi:serine/threonine protein kinase/tetratricopeptide (TPR) repeat protein
MPEPVPSRPAADRNLLFGILALQLDFVSRDQLIAAMHAWVLQKATPLGEVFLAQGALGRDRHALLEALVQEHLQQHGGDPEQSLAALSSLGPVRDDLRQIPDADLHASLAHLPRTRPDEGDPHATRAPVAGRPAPAGQRFRILRPHARGGLGEVYVARDEELHRDVALKEIQAEYADQPESRARFLREAEVTGGLEHPGVVPVYGLGRYADGRPYYAMRFIRGDSLKEAIAAFHSAEGPGRDPGERALAFRGLLGRFVDVCNAVAYAHSRGVLHRDLKPGNVMLGKYGETLVVDWGLAKPLGRDEAGGEASEAPLVPASGDGASATQAGQVIGTPAFMSPEQAAGRVDRLGPASDVYSLGATLYALLTGRAPAGGHDNGDRPRPSQVTKGVTKALDGVCGKAMALRPEDRYPSALDLAGDVEHWLADEPVTAYRDPLTVRLTRWGRRHRTAVTTGAALLLTALVALSLGLVAVNAEKNRTAQAERETRDALERSRQAEMSAGEQRQLALKTVRNVVNDIDAQLKDRPAQAKLRKALLGRALAGLKEVARAADTTAAIDYATVWAHFELGDIFLEIEEGGSAEAKRQYEKAHDLARQVWEASPESAQAQRALAVSHSKLGDVYLQRGDSKEALDSYQKGLQLHQRLAGTDSTSAQAQRDLSISHSDLGDVYLRLGDSQAALDSYKSCHAFLERLADADPSSAQAQSDLATSHNRLGDVYLRLGDSRAALDSYKKGLALRQRLADADPTSALAQRDLSLSHNSLGDVYLELGDSRAALDSYQKALEIRQRLADADNTSAQAQRDLSVSHEKLGDVYRELGDSQAALDSQNKALEISRRLANADPTSAQAQRDLAVSHIKVGDIFLRLDDSQAALDSYKSGHAILERLADADPISAQAQRELALSHERLGAVYLELGDSKAALDRHKKGLAVRQRLADADKTSAQAQRDLSISYGGLGDVYLRLGDSKTALDSYKKDLEISQRLADGDRTSAQAQRDLLVSYFKLGNVTQQTYDFKAAESWYVRALDIPQRFPKPEVFKQQVTLLEGQVRFCRAAEQAVSDPSTACKQADDLRRPVLFFAMYALARKEKQPGKAVAAAEMLAANAKEPDDLYNAACGYALCVPLADTPEAKEKYAARAVALLRQAVAKGFKDATQMKKDADLGALRQRDDFKKLLAELEAATRPKH